MSVLHSSPKTYCKMLKTIVNGTNIPLRRRQLNFLLYGHNLGQSICRLFLFLAQFLFTVSETELDYYHHNPGLNILALFKNLVQVRITTSKTTLDIKLGTRVAEQLKT